MLFLRPIFGRAGRPSGGPLVNRWAALAIPVLVFLLVFLLQFPMGLIAWLAFRPPMPGISTVTGIPKDPDSDLKRRANEGRL